MRVSKEALPLSWVRIRMLNASQRSVRHYFLSMKSNMKGRFLKKAGNTLSDLTFYMKKFLRMKDDILSKNLKND